MDAVGKAQVVLEAIDDAVDAAFEIVASKAGTLAEVQRLHAEWDPEISRALGSALTPLLVTGNRQRAHALIDLAFDDLAGSLGALAEIEGSEGDC